MNNSALVAVAHCCDDLLVLRDRGALRNLRVRPVLRPSQQRSRRQLEDEIHVSMRLILVKYAQNVRMTQLRVQLHLVGQLREHVSDRQGPLLDNLDGATLCASPAGRQAEGAAGLPRGKDNRVRALAEEELIRVP